jgi:hypothetical protein
MHDFTCNASKRTKLSSHRMVVEAAMLLLKAAALHRRANITESVFSCLLLLDKNLPFLK